MNKICFATQNKNKIAEVQKILAGLFEVVSLSDLNIHEELPEETDTFEGNSLQKARYVWEKTQTPCFADDSGLEVDTLNGAPGVHSAYYAGEAKNYDANNRLLLQNMAGKTNRRARFRTCITFIDALGHAHRFDGIVTGTLTTELRGTNGFGYDPLFIPDGETRTFAEMDAQEKNAISHRARAVTQLADFLRAYSRP